ncbi:MAG: MarR family winged helix-turn-helix transcriptional regulator [Methanomassiliicoccales archaeon]|jgi:DNA-binding MarR family transcriptional regulator
MKYKDLFVSPQKMKSVMDSQVNRLLKDTGLKSSHLPFIISIGENDGCSMKDLCLMLGIDKGLVTRVVRALINDGLVINASQSGKTYKLSLTEEGREAFKISSNVIDQVIEDVINVLDEDDIIAMRRITAKMNKKFDESYKY